MALMTLYDAVKDSQISDSTWRRWIREGRVEALRVGRQIRIERTTYRKFLRTSRMPMREE